jgi:2,3-bisphosphoglycerate-independent phosphoglycerate mutase
MKYVVFLLDGMADVPVPELGNLTPLEAAKTPALDSLSSNAAFGTFVTLPEPYPTSSDVANMSVMGWDVPKYYSGRGAIESYGAGFPLDDRTIAFRMNLVTVKDGILEDYSAGHITEKEADTIIRFLKKNFDNEKLLIRKGVSYRHLLYLIGKEFSPALDYDKPDSSQGMEWEKILPRARSNDPAAVMTAKLLVDLVYRSKQILADHPVNKKRIKAGLNPANLIWPWSGGGKPSMPTFVEMYGKKGAVVSAVDVILGLGRVGGMDAVKPKGATGYIDTNYENKAKAGVKLLKKNDFVYIHVEAADECAHMGDIPNKIRAIEDSDQRLIRVFLKEYAKNFKEDLRVMVLPDHPVPVKLRKHTRDAVPFVISGFGVKADPSIRKYSEAECRKGKYQDLKGRELMDLFFSEKLG